MFRFVIHWLLAAVTVLIASKVVPGFFTNGLGPVMITAVVVGFLNAGLGYLMKTMTSAVGIFLFGLLLVVLNGALILGASQMVDGFYVYSWTPAAWAAGALVVLGLVIRAFSQE